MGNNRPVGKPHGKPHWCHAEGQFCSLLIELKHEFPCRCYRQGNQVSIAETKLFKVLLGSSAVILVTTQDDCSLNIPELDDSVCDFPDFDLCSVPPAWLLNTLIFPLQLHNKLLSSFIVRCDAILREPALVHSLPFFQCYLHKHISQQSFVGVFTEIRS